MKKKERMNNINVSDSTVFYREAVVRHFCIDNYSQRGIADNNTRQEIAPQQAPVQCRLIHLTNDDSNDQALYTYQLG